LHFIARYGTIIKKLGGVLVPGKSFLEYVFDKAGIMRIPVFGTLELTARCNLSCKMCYIHEKENDPLVLQKEQPTEFWLDFIEQAQAMGTLLVLITGGEPLLRKDFKEIYLACKKAGLLVSVNTNGTLISSEYVEFFQKYPPFKLNISLYGASSTSYEALCGIGQMYERVSGAIRALRAANVPVKINYTVTEFNHNDTKQIYDFAKELGVPVQHTTYMFPAVRAAENGVCSSCRVCAEQAAAYAVACDREKFPPEIFMQRAKALAEGYDLPKVGDEDPLRAPKERIFCRAGVCSFWLTYDARLLPCGMLHCPSVPLDRPFAELWETLKELTQEIYLPQKCSDCKKRPYCEVCAAVCYGENGRFDEVPEYMCRKTEAFLKQMNTIYKEEFYENQ